MPVTAILITATVIVALLYLAGGAVHSVVSAIRVGGRREDDVDGQSAVSQSRFTIPVSVVVPVSNDDGRASKAIAALLALNYPEFEVIVVAEAPSREWLDRLADEWQLEAKEYFYRRTIATSPINRMYRSARDARLAVVDKTSSGYSDALNCGVNMARYRYIVSISPEIAFDANALLRMMSAALRDPGRVIGVSSHVEQHGGGTTAAFGRLAAVRAFMDSRLGSLALPAGLGPDGGVVVWRRDAVLAANGFSAGTDDPNLDLALRAQSADAAPGSRFERGASVFGYATDESRSNSDRRSAAARQRAALQMLAKWMTGRTGRIDPATVRQFLARELLVPVAHAWVLGATLVGVVSGWFPWLTVVLMLALLSFGHATVALAALLLRGASPGAPEGTELLRLLAVSPLDFLAHRPALAAARIGAVWSVVAQAVRPATHR